MAWPYLEGIIKVVITYRIGGKVAVNVTFAKLVGGGPVQPGDLVAVAEAAETAWWTNWTAAASDEAEVTKIEAINWEADAGEIYTLLPDPAIIGVKTGGIVTNNVALVVTHLTSRTGRSYRGRSYIPGLDEVDLDATEVTTAQVLIDLVEIFTLFDSELDTAGYTHCVYSLYTDGAPRVAPIAWHTQGYSANPRVDTQRRRLPK